MRIHANLNKQLFFPDELVVVEYLVDNSRSEKDIKEIRGCLKWSVVVRRAGREMQRETVDLQMLEFKGVQK